MRGREDSRYLLRIGKLLLIPNGLVVAAPTDTKEIFLRIWIF